MSTEPINLDEAERLAQAATPAPWEQNGQNGIHTPQGEAVALTHRGETRKADAEFIAAARTLVPDLVAELRDARAEVERLNDVIAAMDQDDDDRIDDLADARAKLAAVLALHQPTGIFTEWSGTEHAVCCVCGKLPWPCPTVAAVGAVGVQE